MGSLHFERSSITRTSGKSQGRTVAPFAEYMTRDTDEKVQYVEARNMPSWATEDPVKYWQAVDSYERSNGRLAEVWMAQFPRELPKEGMVRLTQDFLRVQHADQCPVLWVIHETPTRDGQGKNVHSHILVSGRLPDGIEREPAQMFLRYNATDPDRGGNPKAAYLYPTPHSIWRERHAYADLCNWHAESVGLDWRCDLRSLQARGITREPERYAGYYVGADVQQALTVQRNVRQPEQVQEACLAAQYWEQRKRVLGIEPGMGCEAAVERIAVQFRAPASPQKSLEQLRGIEQEAGAAVKQYTREFNAAHLALMQARHWCREPEPHGRGWSPQLGPERGRDGYGY